MSGRGGGGIEVVEAGGIQLGALPAYQRHATYTIDVRGLGYEVAERGLEWWQRLAAFQMPWEWRSGGGGGKRRILQDVSFSVRSGQMLAVLGSSGSGKTTLLDVVSDQVSGGDVSGSILINGRDRTANTIKEYSAYVRQSDRLLPHLTVRETLMFVAQLKLPTSWSQIEVKDRVESVIAELGLRHVADTKVGGAEVRGISGGERRRVSIGVQLLLDPSLLFVDEPTSGLDSFTAHHLVETLARLANNNRVVLLTIHQPRSDIFELFDLIMLLSQGQVVYYGRADHMVDYFTSLGYPCPELTNPCDYYVDLTTVDMKTDESESSTGDRVKQLVEIFREYQEKHSRASSHSRDSSTPTSRRAGAGAAASDEVPRQQRTNGDVAHEDGIITEFRGPVARLDQVYVNDAYINDEDQVTEFNTSPVVIHMDDNEEGSSTLQHDEQQQHQKEEEEDNQKQIKVSKNKSSHKDENDTTENMNDPQISEDQVHCDDDNEHSHSQSADSPSLEECESPSSSVTDYAGESASNAVFESSQLSEFNRPAPSSSAAEYSVPSTSDENYAEPSTSAVNHWEPSTSPVDYSIPSTSAVDYLEPSTTAVNYLAAPAVRTNEPAPAYSPPGVPAPEAGMGSLLFGPPVSPASAGSSFSRSESSLRRREAAAILVPQEERAGKVAQFWILFRRALANNLEDYSFLGVQAIEALSMSLMIGLVFYNLGVDQISIRDRFGLLYIIGALYPYMVILDVVGQYHREKNILYFEMQDNLYSSAPYFFSKIFSELPEHTFFIILYASPVYFMAGLQDDVSRFFQMFAVCFIVVYASRAMAMFAGALMPTYQMSVLVAQSLFTVFLLSCGFIFNLENIWSGVKWTSAISYLKWSYQALCYIEFKHLNFTCEGLPAQACITTGEDALKVYSLDGFNSWQCSLIVCAEILIFLVLFFVGLKFVSQKPHEQ